MDGCWALMRLNRHVDIKTDLSLQDFVTRLCHTYVNLLVTPSSQEMQVYNALINFMKARVQIHMKKHKSLETEEQNDGK